MKLLVLFVQYDFNKYPYFKYNKIEAFNEEEYKDKDILFL